MRCSWVTQECREGRGRFGSGTECEVEVGDGGETGRGEDGKAAAVADGGSADGSRRGHQTDVPYSGAKAATWSSMRGTSGTSEGPRRGEVEGQRRLVGQIASGSAVCDATNLVRTGCVDCGLAWSCVVVLSGRPLAWFALGSAEWSPSDSVRDPSPACPVLSRSCSCLVQSWPVSPSRGRGSELKRCCSAAVLQVCRCWRPSVSRRAWMTLTILDLGFGLFGDQSRGRAAQEPGWPGAGQERANRLSPWLGLDVGIMDAPGLGLPACRRDKEGKSILGIVAYPKHHDCGSAPQHGERERRSGGGVESE